MMEIQSFYEQLVTSSITRAEKKNSEMVALSQTWKLATQQPPSAQITRQTPLQRKTSLATPIRMVLRARFYDPQTAEFISTDPLEYVDGMSLFRGYFVIAGIDPDGMKSVRVSGHQQSRAESRLSAFCDGVENCRIKEGWDEDKQDYCYRNCDKKACLDLMYNLVTLRTITTACKKTWNPKKVKGEYGGYCHYWSHKFSTDAIDLYAGLFRDGCISLPKKHVVPVVDSRSIFSGDGKLLTNWTDHGIAVIKNKCTGKCLVFDNGFWGRATSVTPREGYEGPRSEFADVFDPCSVGRPPMVTGSLGVAKWNEILADCNCGPGATVYPNDPPTGPTILTVTQ